MSVEWTTASLQGLIADLRRRQGDATDVEVKSAAGGCPSLGATICAFANMPEGGTIILGLDEGAGFAPVGLTDLAGLEQAVAAQARTSVNPPAHCEFKVFQVGGKPVLVATIEALPLRDRPARHGGQAYLRQSDGDYVMSEQEIAQIELLKTQSVRPTQPDRLPVPYSSLDDLDKDLVESFLAAARRSSRRYASASDEDILGYTSVLTKTGELTLAGLYALGRFPQTASPSLSVTAAVQLPAGAEARTRDLVHMVGPIPELLDEAMAWVVRNTRTSMGYDDRGHGIDVTEIPMRAVREIVANALVHRNLDAITDSKRVEIRLLRDRLVITSPGGLWGVSESQLGRPGAKSAVNPVLYDICKYVRMDDGSRVIEGEGGGIREAVEALRSAGLRAPHFIDTGVQFTVIVSRHTLIGEDDLAWLADVVAGAELSSEQRAVLVSMRRGEVWTNARVRQELGPMDSVAARRLLQQLVDTGLAEMHGERGSASYTIASAHLLQGPDDVVVEELPAQPRLVTELEYQDRDPDRSERAVITESRARRPTRNGKTLVAALGTSARTFEELVGATGLSEGQVRYALSQLIASQAVVMQGAQGVRGTTYAVPTKR